MPYLIRGFFVQTALVRKDGQIEQFNNLYGA
jgi:hypothetical protein